MQNSLKLIFILLMNFQILFSQNADYIYGTVLDANTKEPIVFANIYLKGREMGVISNKDGGFRFPEQYREMGAVLVFSSMGYESKELSVLDFLGAENTIVTLVPAVFNLNEAVVRASRKKRSLSAKDIVQNSINLLLENYPVSPYSQIGYYRDYQLDGSGYVNLNEVILEVFDQGFDAIDSITSKTLLYDIQQNKDFPRDSIALRPYNYNLEEGGKIVDNAYLDAHGGNEFILLKVHNAIRNHVINSFSFINRFDRDLLKNHTFKRNKDTYIDNEQLYTIEFKNRIPKIAALGRLYISKHDYSIYKMEYFVYQDSSIDESEIFNEDNINNQLIFEVITEYRREKGKMFLNFISFHNKFSVREPPRFVLENVNINIHSNTVLKNNLKIDGQSFTLTFNNDIDEASYKNLRNRKISFKNQKIKIKRILIVGNQMVIHPDLDQTKFRKLFMEMEKIDRNEGLTSDLFDFKTQDLMDVDGNKINVWTSKDYNQFREFFVQETVLEPQVIDEALLMKKDRPIFENQPINKPDDFQNYWMNTPLQHKKQ